MERCHHRRHGRGLLASAGIAVGASFPLADSRRVEAGGDPRVRDRRAPRRRFGLLLGFVAPQHLKLGTGVFGIGVGITAYTLGMRHAFDADHIGAIDNTTRKLMADGQRPLSVGFFFSLGHSSVVFLLAAGFALGIRGLSGDVSNDSSSLHRATGLIGPAVSGSFLFLIGILNLVVLIGIVRIFLRMRQGHFDEQQLEDQLDSRGFMNRFYGRATRAVKKPWQMYPSASCSASASIRPRRSRCSRRRHRGRRRPPDLAILCLPILFAAGMSLLDTIDGAFMNFAYGWAFSKPVRKIFYNITVTALSVVVALVIGTIELLAVFADKLSLTGSVWHFAERRPERRRLLLVALFVGTWVSRSRSGASAASRSAGGEAGSGHGTGRRAAACRALALVPYDSGVDAVRIEGPLPAAREWASRRAPWSIGRLGGGMPASALLVGSIISIQCGSALATTLFSRGGVAGTAFLRCSFAALVLIAMTRPRLRGRSRVDLTWLAVFGLLLAGMNITFYEAIDRLLLGVVVTVEFLGPLAVATVLSRRLAPT